MQLILLVVEGAVLCMICMIYLWYLASQVRMCAVGKLSFQCRHELACPTDKSL